MKSYLKWMLYKYSAVLKYIGIGLLLVLGIEIGLAVLGSYFEVFHIIAILFSSLANLLLPFVYIVMPILFMVNQAFGKGLEQVLIVPTSRYKVLFSQIIFGVAIQAVLTIGMIIAIIPMMVLLQSVVTIPAEPFMLGDYVPVVVLSFFGTINTITTWQLLFYGSQTRLAKRIPKWVRVLIIIVAYFTISFAFEFGLHQLGFSGFQIGFQAGISMAGSWDMLDSDFAQFDYSQLALVIYLVAISLLTFAEYSLARYFLKHKVEI